MNATMNDRNPGGLPREQLIIRDGCLPPGVTFVEFRKEDVEQSIPDRFEKIARQQPGRLAIKLRDHQLTYGELNRAANRLARAIIFRQDNEAAPVALLIEKGSPLIAAMLGVLKAGKFFALLDPSFPKARIKAVLEDSQAELIVTDSQNASLAREAAGGRCRLVEYESIDSGITAENLGLHISPTNLAYLIYTSGSTGQPKGVVQSHRSLLHNMMLRTNAIPVCVDDRISLLTSGTANTVTNTFYTLLNGAGLLPYDVPKEGVARLGNWLLQESVTILWISSPLFRKFCVTLTGRDGFPSLRLLRLMSETAHKTDVDLYKKHFAANCLLVNGLHSSETGVLALYFMNQNSEITGTDVPVGYAVEDKEIVLLDDEGNKVGCNEVGQIAVRSRYLSPGYWRRPDLTEAKFKFDPGGGEESLYFTGDLGLMLPDGCLIHKGRKDFRIKIRGYGVDIAEVEKALRDHASIGEVVVVGSQDKSGEGRLVAYFTSHSRPAPNVSELRRFLNVKLPDYMIPSAFVAMESFPLTSNGKIDRKFLPTPEVSRPELDTLFEGPRTPIEHRLVQIWEAVLDIRPIGVNDDFFDLGGHSLLVAQLIGRIERDFHVALPGRVLFECVTIAELADEIKFRQGQGFEFTGGLSNLIKLQSGRSQKKIFCFPFAGGFKDEYVHFVRLARLIGPDYSFYGLQARGVDGVSQPYHRIEDMAADYVRNIRSAQPHGPYFVVGDCGGCSEAFETARQLRTQGEEIALLAILDDEGRRPLGRYLWHRLTARPRYRMARITESRPWNHLKARLVFHLGEIQGMGAGERLRYLFGKIGKAGSLIVDSRREAASQAQPTNVNGSSAFPQVLQHMKYARRVRYLARSRYWHRPYDGRVTLMVNEEWYEWHQSHDSDPTLGWARLAAGGVEVHKIPGNHETYITQNIHVVAEELKKCLQKREAGSPERFHISPDVPSRTDRFPAALS